MIKKTKTIFLILLLTFFILILTNTSSLAFSFECDGTNYNFCDFDNLISNGEHYIIQNSGQLLVGTSETVFTCNDGKNVYWNTPVKRYLISSEEPSLVDERPANSYISGIVYTNTDICDSDGNVVFQAPLVAMGTLAPMVQEMSLEAVMKEILEILPVILITIVGLISLRKGLQVLSTVLHRS